MSFSIRSYKSKDPEEICGTLKQGYIGRSVLGDYLYVGRIQGKHKVWLQLSFQNLTEWLSEKNGRKGPGKSGGRERGERRRKEKEKEEVERGGWRERDKGKLLGSGHNLSLRGRARQQWPHRDKAREKEGH